MIVLMICQAIYTVLTFFSEKIMIASWVAVVFLTEIVESIIWRTKYPQENFHYDGDKKNRQKNRHQSK
jgi:hypothetical protein